MESYEAMVVLQIEERSMTMLTLTREVIFQDLGSLNRHFVWKALLPVVQENKSRDITVLVSHVMLQ